MALLQSILTMFRHGVAPLPPSGTTVSGAVTPPKSLLKTVAITGLVVAFCVWMARNNYKESQKANAEQAKSSMVSPAPPDTNPLLGLIKEKNAAQGLAAMQMELQRQEQQQEAAHEAGQQGVVGKIFSGKGYGEAGSQGTAGAGAATQADQRIQQERERAAEAAAKEAERLRQARFTPGRMIDPDAGTEVARTASAPSPRPPDNPGAAPSPQVPPAAAGSSVAKEKASVVNRSDCLDKTDSGERLYAICEGSQIMAIGSIRMNGDFAGPALAVLDQDVSSRDRQHLLLPKGTQVIGTAAQVDKANQQRLQVTFHRILLPDGRGYRLSGAPALEPAGDVALKDKVNRHLMSKFSAAVVMGGLAGFSQAGTGSALTAGGLDMYRQGVSAQLGQTGQQIVQSQMNRPNGVTINEGHMLVIYLSEDLLVPEYRPNVVTTFGGTTK